MKSSTITAATIATFVLLSVSCKNSNQAPDSKVKDFAANPNAKNFAIIAGYMPENINGVKSDIYNWNNILNRGALGTYSVIYSDPQANVKDLTAAFASLGSSLQSDSTFVFAFSGKREGTSLRLADGQVNFADLMAAAKNKSKASGQRFYVMHDSLASGSDSSYLVAALKGAPSEALFVNTVEFKASSPASSSSKGRLATEFAGALDHAVLTKSRASIRDFFDEVLGKTALAGGPKATYSVTNNNMLSESLLTSVSPKVSAGQGPIGSGPLDLATLFGSLFNQGGGSINRLNNNSNGYNSNGNNSNGNNFNGNNFNGNNSNNNNFGNNQPNGIPSGNQGSAAKYVLIEASLSFCGPCQQMAGSIAKDSAYTNPSSPCAVRTIIADGKLDEWNSAVSNGFTEKHSEVGSSEDLRQKYPQFEFSSFPVVFLTDAATGKVVDSNPGPGGYPSCPNGSAPASGKDFFNE